MYPYNKRTLERYLGPFEGRTYIEVYNIKGVLVWTGMVQALSFDINADSIKLMEVSKCAIYDNRLIVSVM